MCGIAGFFGGGNREDIQRMTDAMIHRGPDDGNIFMDDNVALGHRRLSIVDLEYGAQPMRDGQSGLIITYNGEIYNHLALRNELERMGHVFHSRHSDTETVLHAFAQWGIDCLPRFNGMFAFAIYNPADKKFWLARDRFGEKPLFYVENAHGFAFASEIGALSKWPGFDKAFDETNIQRFFAWNYLPGSRCAHKQCQSLSPGAWLCYDLQNRQISTGRYWSFQFAPDETLTESKEPELVEELQRLLVQAVRRRLLSDVPLGIFLSGGIDSSAVLASAVQITDTESINTFTIGFNEASFDESAKARQVAEYLGVNNHVEYLTEQVMRDSIGDILSRMGEPFGDASLIPTYHLSKFTRQSVKVALTGDGGDELFGGYDPLAAIRPAFYYRRLVPGFAHRLARKIFSYLPASDRNMSLEFRMKRMLKGLSWPAEMTLPIWMSGLDPAEIGEFFHNPLNARELYEDAIKLYERHRGASGLEQAMLFFTCLYLTDDILVKADRASMMCSLETRAVFLDNDIVEFCQKLPARFKYRNGHRKYILKKALGKMLPKNILNQPKKGFGIPLNRWLRSLPEPNIPVPGLKDGVIDFCYRQHKKRLGDFRYFLWDLQSFSRLEH